MKNTRYNSVDLTFKCEHRKWTSNQFIEWIHVEFCFRHFEIFIFISNQCLFLSLQNLLDSAANPITVLVSLIKCSMFFISESVLLRFVIIKREKPNEKINGKKRTELDVSFKSCFRERCQMISRLKPNQIRFSFRFVKPASSKFEISRLCLIINAIKEENNKYSHNIYKYTQKPSYDREKYNSSEQFDKETKSTIKCWSICYSNIRIFRQICSTIYLEWNSWMQTGITEEIKMQQIFGPLAGKNRREKTYTISASI